MKTTPEQQRAQLKDLAQVIDMRKFKTGGADERLATGYLALLADLEDANDSIYELNKDYKMATQLAASYLNELQEVHQQLAEAQAVLLDAARHGAAYALLRAGADGAEVSDEELTALLPTPDCPPYALQSAISAAVEPYKRDAERWAEVARRFDNSKTSASELVLQGLGLDDGLAANKLAEIIDAALPAKEST